MGPGAADLVGRLFQPASGKSLTEHPLGRIVFGRWSSGEELVVCRREPDLVEVHCHGGQAAPRAILDSLVAEGAATVDWRDWLRAQQHDPISADAWIALAEARTHRTASILLEQFHGALRREIEVIQLQLAEGQLETALAKIRKLLARASVGLHLIVPYRVVLAGRPNAGKSSLINALVGYRRAIVAETPGTTRDVVTASAAFEGWPVELADTAGLRQARDPLEAAGVDLATDRLSSADLVILLVDVSQRPTDEQEPLRAAWPDALVVLSKCDLPRQLGQNVKGLEASAVTGQGLPELEHAIANRLVSHPPASGEAVPFTAQQVATLGSVLDLLERNEPRAARERLDELLSRRPTPASS